MTLCFPKRPRTLGALAFFLAGAALAFEARAETASAKPANFRTLALGTTVSGVCFDRNGRQVLVTAGSTGFSAPYAAPSDGKIAFYRMLPAETPGAPARRAGLADIRLDGEGPFLIFMLAPADKPAEARMLTVDDSWTAHPSRTLKIHNFSRRAALVKVGEESAELAPSRSGLFAYPQGTLWLQVATKETEGWVLRLSGPQMTLPRSRSTIVLVDQLPSEDRPVANDLLVRNLIDPEPPAETP